MNLNLNRSSTSENPIIEFTAVDTAGCVVSTNPTCPHTHAPNAYRFDGSIFRSFRNAICAMASWPHRHTPLTRPTPPFIAGGSRFGEDDPRGVPTSTWWWNFCRCWTQLAGPVHAARAAGAAPGVFTASWEVTGVLYRGAVIKLPRAPSARVFCPPQARKFWRC